MKSKYEDDLQYVEMNDHRIYILTPDQIDVHQLDRSGSQIIKIPLKKGNLIGVMFGNRGDLYKATHTEEWLRTTDFAVPQSWFDLPENKYKMNRGDRAVWHYGDHDYYGGPIWDSETKELLRKKILREIGGTQERRVLRKVTKKPTQKTTKKKRGGKK